MYTMRSRFCGIIKFLGSWTFVFRDGAMGRNWICVGPDYEENEVERETEIERNKNNKIERKTKHNDNDIALVFQCFNEWSN